MMTQRRSKSRRGSQSKKKDEKQDDSLDPMNLLRKLTQQSFEKRNIHASFDGDQGQNELLSESESSGAQGRNLLSVDDHNHALPQGSTTSTTCLPEWYEDLTEDDSSAFKELFDMLDSAKTGTLNADSLYEGLRRVDSDITKEEVETVLKSLDKDGNGEIDFDEFLFHMTQGDLIDEGDHEKKRGKKYSRRQRLFYTAITQFSLKNTLGDIERSYLARMRQAPHVLSHYTAGVRLIGLTDRQLARQMKKMQKSARQHDSPYAKPLPFVSQHGSIKTIARPQSGNSRVHSRYQLSTARTQIAPPMKDKKPMRLHPNMNEQKEYSAIPMPTMEDKLKEPLKIFTARDSVVSKLPGADLIAKIRSKLMKNHMQSELGEKSTDVIEEEEDDEENDSKSKTPSENDKSSVNSGWRIPKVPKIECVEVSLPVLKIKYLKHRPTIDDLPNIREKATQAINDYYQNMRKATVRNAFLHWDKLYADTIRPKKLLENFRTVYRAYSPHKEEEAFVVCPWIPGPYRQFRQSKNGSRSGRTSECGFNGYPQRPFSSVH